MSKSKTYSVTCSAVGGFSYASNFKLYVKLTDSEGDSSTNKSKLTYKVWCEADGSGSISAKHALYFKLNGKEIINETKSISASSPDASFTLASGSMTVKHNDDGSKDVSFSAKVTASSYGVKASTSGTFALEDIPRYFSKKPEAHKTGKTETTYTIEWSTSETCSKVVFYMGSKTKTWEGSAKSGSITMTGLTADTKYAGTYIIATRKDSGLTTQSTPTDRETYPYPYIESISVSELTIGNSQTISLYNPLSRSVAIKMYKTNTSGTQLYSGSTTGTSITFTPNANTLYNSIPSAQSSTCVYESSYGTTSTKSGTYKIKGNEVPNFSGGVDVFSDSHYSLTQDSYTVILGYSNMIATIPINSKATGKNGSSIKSYKMVVGSKSTTVNEDTGSAVSMTISGVTSNQAVIYAIDTRGLSTSKTITLNSVQYSNLAITSMSATRKNNIEPQTVLSFSINFWNSKFSTASSSVQNSITEIYYQYKKTTESSWTTGTTKLAYSTNGNRITGNIEIAGDLDKENKGTGFNIENSYNIYLFVRDKLKTSSYTTVLTTGLPAIAIYRNKVAIGAKYDTTIGKTLAACGALQVYGIVRSTNKSDFAAIAKTRTVGGSDYTGYFGIGSISDQGTIALELQNSDGTILNRIDMTPDKTYWGRGEGKLYSPNSSGIYFDKWGNIHNQRAGSEGGNFSISSDSTILSMNWNSGVSTFYYGISAKSYISFANGGGTSYAGICNASGVPIIRDHNNQNVTVDATGGKLFLGFQSTNSIDILDGKSWFDGDGDLNVNIVVPKTNGTGSVGITSRRWSAGYINVLYGQTLSSTAYGENAVYTTGTAAYFGPGSGASSVTTYLRGQTVRLYSHKSGAVYLGSSGSTAITSDEKLKDLFEIDNRYVDFFNNLKPVAYKYKLNGHRSHLGFGARQVEQALLDAGLTTEDFAGVLKDKDVTIYADENGTDEDIHYDELYSLRYEEFTSLNTLMIQKALKEIQEIKNKIGG